MTDQLPNDVIEYINRVFRECNHRISKKISAVPNVSEPSLDMTFIEHLTQYSSPVVLSSDWIIRIDTHFLGGLRHFYRWEIADIGLLIFFRRAGKVIRRKVVLVQSKRLYPDNSDVIEEDVIDYKIGFARLASDDSVSPLSVSRKFTFGNDSKYSALQVGDEQYEAIEKYESAKNIPIYYLLYNAWEIPSSYFLPLTEPASIKGEGNGGCRIIPSSSIRSKLSGMKNGYSPKFEDICGLVDPSLHIAGWQLEYFISELVIKCKEGRVFDGAQDEDIQSLFFRRTGPIAAAIAISIEMPENANFEWNA